MLAKKKTAYEDFKRLRKDNQELQKVKANVDAFLRIEQVQDYEQKKEKSRSRAGKAALWFYRLVYSKAKAGSCALDL